MCCLHSSGRASGLLSWFASWVTFPICPVMSGVFSVMSFARSARSSNPCAMTRATLLSPWIVVTAFVSLRTMNQYAHGRAALHPQPAFICCGQRNPDAGWTISPMTRLPIIAEPERSRASRFIWRVNDCVANTLATYIGPQKGSWTGDVPSREKVSAALAKGRRVWTTDLVSVPDLYARVDCAMPDSRWPIRRMYIDWTPPIVGSEEWFKDLEGVAPPELQVLLQGKQVRLGHLGGLLIFGTGPEFFVLVDPVSDREVARFEAPSR